MSPIVFPPLSPAKALQIVGLHLRDEGRHVVDELRHLLRGRWRDVPVLDDRNRPAVLDELRGDARTNQRTALARGNALRRRADKPFRNRLCVLARVDHPTSESLCIRSVGMLRGLLQIDGLEVLDRGFRILREAAFFAHQAGGDEVLEELRRRGPRAGPDELCDLLLKRRPEPRIRLDGRDRLRLSHLHPLATAEAVETRRADSPAAPLAL